MNDELVSIIVPVYNGEQFLERALKSAFSQTYANVEVVVINDGSTDNTLKILKEYEKEHSNLKVLNQSNGGEGKARNRGVQVAHGTYIAFLDADDYMHPNMIEIMLESMYKNKTEIAICSYNIVDENGSFISLGGNLANESMNNKEALKRFLLSFEIEGFCWNKLIRKSLYEEIYYDETVSSYCDILASCKLLYAATGITFVKEALYDYYQVSQSCVHTLTIQKAMDFNKVITQVRDFAYHIELVHEADYYYWFRILKQLFYILRHRNLYERRAFNDYFLDSYKKINEYSIKNRFRFLRMTKKNQFWKVWVSMMLVDLYYCWLCVTRKNL